MRLLLVFLAVATARAAAPVDLRGQINGLASTTFGFWQRHGLDTQHGGFHGTLGRDGTPLKPTKKGLVQTARHLWAFSAYHQQHGSTSPTNTSSPSAADMAAAAYSFLTRHLLHAPSNMFHWSVSRDGTKVVDGRKVLYGQWFAVYGLSKYAEVFGSMAAKKAARACLDAVEAAYHNKTTGGYNTLTSNQIPSTLAKRDPPTLVPTTLNDVLHGMEALAQLYKVDQSNLVKARLLELLRLLCVDLVVQGRLLSEYHPPGSAGQAWVPIDGAIVDYGHNIEASWLINDALGVLEAAGSIDAAVLQQYRAAAFAIGAKAAAEGWDSQHGGLFLLGTPGQAPSSTEKVWWVQAEAAVAFWDLHHRHNSQAGYLQKLSDTVNFITKHLNDPVHGEWVWQVAADGAALDNFSPGLTIKGNEWKASYHTLRMLLELQRRL